MGKANSDFEEKLLNFEGNTFKLTFQCVLGLCDDQALAGSTISIPGFSGRDFAKIPGSRDFRDRD